VYVQEYFCRLFFADSRGIFTQQELNKNICAPWKEAEREDNHKNELSLIYSGSKGFGNE